MNQYITNLCEKNGENGLLDVIVIKQDFPADSGTACSNVQGDHKSAPAEATTIQQKRIMCTFETGNTFKNEKSQNYTSHKKENKRNLS